MFQYVVQIGPAQNEECSVKVVCGRTWSSPESHSLECSWVTAPTLFKINGWKHFSALSTDAENGILKRRFPCLRYTWGEKLYVQSNKGGHMHLFFIITYMAVIKIDTFFASDTFNHYYNFLKEKEMAKWNNMFSYICNNKMMQTKRHSCFQLDIRKHTIKEVCYILFFYQYNLSKTSANCLFLFATW